MNPGLQEGQELVARPPQRRQSQDGVKMALPGRRWGVMTKGDSGDSMK